MMENFQKENNMSFNYILRVRSDVIFKNPIILKNFEKDKITVPDFHYWNGINDRFAFGKKNLMRVYMNMFNNIYIISRISNKKMYLKNAEHFAKINLDINNIQYIHEKNILFNRVRMNGKVLKDSF